MDWVLSQNFAGETKAVDKTKRLDLSLISAQRTVPLVGGWRIPSIKRQSDQRSTIQAD